MQPSRRFRDAPGRDSGSTTPARRRLAPRAPASAARRPHALDIGEHRLPSLTITTPSSTISPRVSAAQNRRALAHLEQHARDFGRERRLAAAADREIADADDGRGETAPQMRPALVVAPAAPRDSAVKKMQQTVQWTTRNGRTTPIDPPRSGSSCAMIGEALVFGAAIRLDQRARRGAEPRAPHRIGQQRQQRLFESARARSLESPRPAR